MTDQHKLFAPLLMVAAFFSLFIVSPAKADIVNICDDAALWPPFAYAPLVNGEPDQSQIQGATVDLLAVIFDEIGLQHSITLLPWKRCMREVENFAYNRNFEMISNGSYSAERAEKYHASLPLYGLNRGIYYSVDRFPDGIEIS